MTGSPVRSQYRKPGEPRSRPADAIIVAPATYNTINKWAQGISDTYALGILAETTALGVPIVVLPFVNSALAARAPFRRSIRRSALRRRSHPAGPRWHRATRSAYWRTLIAKYPWHLALNHVEKLTALASIHRMNLGDCFRGAGPGVLILRLGAVMGYLPLTVSAACPGFSLGMLAGGSPGAVVAVGSAVTGLGWSGRGCWRAAGGLEQVHPFVLAVPAFG